MAEPGFSNLGESGTGRDALPIVWLVSYPKSGNTWVRILLGSLFGRERGAAERIPRVGTISSDRALFDNAAGLPSADLTEEEVDLLRPTSYRRLAAAVERPLFIKAHDSYDRNAAGMPIFPADRSRGAILLVRHPMDVAWSYAHHRDRDCADVVEAMADFGHVIGGRGKRQLHQRLSGWSGHYLSWTRQRDIPILVVRYEDLLADTVAMLECMLEFIAEPRDRYEIARAVESARFERLQAIEEEFGFDERPAEARRFFRKGKAGDGAVHLPACLKQRIWTEHRRVMAELGYSETGVSGKWVQGHFQ